MLEPMFSQRDFSSSSQSVRFWCCEWRRTWRLGYLQGSSAGQECVDAMFHLATSWSLHGPWGPASWIMD